MRFVACPPPPAVLRRAALALGMALQAGGALAGNGPFWVPVSEGDRAMQYFIDAETVRQQDGVTYYRLFGRGSEAGRPTTVEAEVGVQCRERRRVEYITTVRTQGSVRTSTATQMEDAGAASRAPAELDTACRLAQQPADRPGGIQMVSAPAREVGLSNRHGAGSANLRWSGTGFAVAPQTVVTNSHVVRGCANLQVMQGRSTFPARVVATDGENDLAALSVQGASLPPLELASAPQELGENVTVLGYPLANLLGSDLRVTTGIVSALSGVGGEEGTMQISAPVQSGNSGGPVLDQSGAVAGVVVKKLDMRFGAENVGFAVRLQPLRRFLSAHGLPFVLSRERPKDASVAQVVRRTAPSVLLVTCAQA